MWLVIIGVVLLFLKASGLAGATQWPWWLVLSPFGAALVWWQIADHVGWTQKAAQRRDEARQQRRKDARMEALGMRPGKSSFGDSRLGPSSRQGGSSRAGASSRTGPPSGSGPTRREAKDRR